MRMMLLCLVALVVGACRSHPSCPHRDFTDMRGRTVSVPKTVQRIVTAGALPAVNAILLVLGKQNAIQNGLPRQLHGGRWGFQEKLNPALVGRPVVSSMGPDWTPDYEALSALTYDVVVLDSMETATAMARRGIQAVALDWRGTDSVRRAVTLLGSLTGCEERAREYVAYYEQLLGRVSARIAGARAPSALYLRLDNYSLPVIANASSVVTSAGGVYAVDASKVPNHATFSHEQLLLWDPDVLFV